MSPFPDPDHLEPIFLVGAERSGSTLLRLMLDHHPAIACHNEFEYVVSQISPDGAYPDTAAYRAWLQQNWIFQDANFTIDASLDYRQLVHSFLGQKLERDGKTMVGATVHYHFDHLLQLWPRARFLHLIRDPRDVARSTIAMGWAGNVWVGVSRWLEAEQTWQDLHARLPAGHYLEVRFEDLIGDAPKALTRICAFLDLAYDNRMLSYADHSTYKPPNPKLVYQWRHRLTEDQIALVEARVGTLMAAKGYPPAAKQPMTVDAAAARKLETESERYCRRFRRQRYGLPLLLLNKLARWLPGEGWANYIRRRIDDIDRNHLQ